MTDAEIQAPQEPSNHEERGTLDTKTAAYFVEKYPGQTSRELSALSGYSPAAMVRRLPEAERLKRKQLVWKGPVRTCRISGRRAVTWWPREVPQ